MSDVIKCGVLTVSDSCFFEQALDRGGPAVSELLRSGSVFPGVEIDVVESDVVPDDVGRIQAKLIDWAAVRRLDLVITTGGTGLSPRDVTPEAVRGVIDRDIFGMSFAMMAGSLEITPMAMISRPVCGVKGTKTKDRKQQRLKAFQFSSKTKLLSKALSDQDQIFVLLMQSI